MALNPYESPRGRMRARAETTRRQFLMIMGGLAAAGASLLGGIKVLSFMFPRRRAMRPPCSRRRSPLSSSPVGS